MTFPKRIVSQKENDILRFTVSENLTSKLGVITMRGTILRTEGGCDIASCGGYLFQFPNSYPLHTKIFITLEISSEATHSQGKKRVVKRTDNNVSENKRITRHRLG